MKVAVLESLHLFQSPRAIHDKYEVPRKEEVLFQTTTSIEARLDTGQASFDRPLMFSFVLRDPQLD